jgi:hypothetical protein
MRFAVTGVRFILTRESGEQTCVSIGRIGATTLRGRNYGPTARKSEATRASFAATVANYAVMSAIGVATCEIIGAIGVTRGETECRRSDGAVARPREGLAWSRKSGVKPPHSKNFSVTECLSWRG